MIDAAAAELDRAAARIDRDGGLPTASIARLRDLGVLAAPLPRAHGGQGLGTEPHGALGLMALLRSIGRADLSLGRLFEGHVNALRLIFRDGDATQRQRAAGDVAAGPLFGLWVTDAEPVRLQGAPDRPTLHGEKLFASGASLVTRALVTATPETGAPRMVLVPLDETRAAGPMPSGLTGMRGAATGRCDLAACAVTREALIGRPGAYLLQPDFSSGAWRGSAVALGGIDRLVDLLRAQLAARGRDSDPHQRVRIGEALIARETASFWTRRAALLAEGEGFAAGDVSATVNLARIACEQSGLAVLALVQRGLGLQAFVQSNPAERVMRDLATYLRQPAPDETLTEAAAWFTGRDLPDPEAA